MKKVLALAISSLFLVACESDSDKTKQSNIAKPSLSQISGVWDVTEISGGKEDQIYTVIKDSGEITDYDYYGDEFDGGRDCYLKYDTDTITDLGNGAFEIIYSEDGVFFTRSMAISDNKLTIKSAEDEFVSFPKSSLSESDFVPLCESVSINSSGLKESFSQKKASIY